MPASKGWTRKVVCSHRNTDRSGGRPLWLPVQHRRVEKEDARCWTSDDASSSRCSRQRGRSRRAQQAERMRRVGILMSVAKDPATEHRIKIFEEELQKLGWTSGRNVQIDVRWGGGDFDRTRKYASELVAIPADVVVASGTVPVEELQRLTRTLPIVFVLVVDPVGQGIVESLARPGVANLTGFTSFEFSICGKWVELLKQIAPRTKRIGVLRDSTGVSQYSVIQATAQPLVIELSPIDTSDAGKIERGIAAFASGPDRGLIVTTSQTSTIHRELIVTLAARHRLPVRCILSGFLPVAAD
jgi:putative ABC transport system substrate-binding protein